jgi:hypothetical protein
MPLWTVHIPAGYSLKPASQTGAVPAGAADLELQRAETMLKLSRLLAGDNAGGTDPTARVQLAKAQDLILEHIRRAEYYAAASDAVNAGKGSSARPVPAGLRRLRDEEARMARAQGFERIGADAEKLPPGNANDPAALFFALPSQGTPTYWEAGPKGGAPHLHLMASAPRQVHATLLASEVILIFLVGLLVLGHLPRVATWLRCLWPEQLLLVAWLGWSAFGVSLVGVVLIVAGVVARLVLLAAWLHRRWQGLGAAGARTGSSVLPVS